MLLPLTNFSVPSRFQTHATQIRPFFGFKPLRMWHFYGKLVNRLPLCFRHPNRVHPSFFQTFPAGPNQSIEFWNEISGNFGWMDPARVFVCNLTCNRTILKLYCSVWLKIVWRSRARMYKSRCKPAYNAPLGREFYWLAACWNTANFPALWAKHLLKARIAGQ